VSPALHHDAAGAPLLDLRAEAEARGPLVLPSAPLTTAERGALVATWRGRMVSEYVSARVFSAMVPQAMAAGLSAAETRELAQMALEEMDHGVRCARVVRALGEPAVANVGALPPVPTHADVAPVEALLRNVIDVSCISETVAVALVSSERALAGTPELALELERILADEVGHARFGWRLVDTIVPALPEATRARLGAYLAVGLHAALERFAPFVTMAEASPAALAVGAPAGPGTFRVLVEALETITVPKLEAAGLPAERAFAAALRALEGPPRSASDRTIRDAA